MCDLEVARKVWGMVLPGGQESCPGERNPAISHLFPWTCGAVGEGGVSIQTHLVLLVLLQRRAAQRPAAAGRGHLPPFQGERVLEETRPAKEPLHWLRCSVSLLFQENMNFSTTSQWCLHYAGAIFRSQCDEIFRVVNNVPSLCVSSCACLRPRPQWLRNRILSKGKCVL